MRIYLMLQVIVFIWCIFEALLESVVIQLKNPGLSNYAHLNKREHQLSGVYFSVLVIGLALPVWHLIAVDYLILLLVMIPIRRLAFDSALKLFRKDKKIKNIEGDQFIDRTSRRIFGSQGGYLEILVMTILIIVANLFIYFIIK